MELNNKIVREKLAALTLATAAAIGVLACSNDGGNEALRGSQETADATELASADEACADSWAVVDANNENSRLIAEGLPSIGEADTNEEAREALNEWFGIVKHDPELLAGTSNALFGTEHKAADLHDGTCFNSAGEQLAADLEVRLASASVAPSEAPTDAHNTGTDAEGNVVVAEQPGITGDRDAIEITDSNGKKFWIMERCGNLVVTDKPPTIPEGPTDQPPLPPETEVTVPTKYDDNQIPGDGAGASQDEGVKDVAGQGPAGQTPNDRGFVGGETAPSVPASSSTTQGQTTPTTERPTATTSPSPTSTNPPVTATSSVPTTAPQNGTLPPRP